MAANDEPARIARAKRMRKEIDELVTPESEGVKPADADQATSVPAPESPRDFIHRRMHELKKEVPPAKED